MTLSGSSQATLRAVHRKMGNDGSRRAWAVALAVVLGFPDGIWGKGTSFYAARTSIGGCRVRLPFGCGRRRISM
jgi:hypothetical protein